MSLLPLITLLAFLMAILPPTLPKKTPEIDIKRLDKASKMSEKVLKEMKNFYPNGDSLFEDAINYKKTADSLYGLYAERFKKGDKTEDVTKGLLKAWRDYAISAYLAIKLSTKSKAKNKKREIEDAKRRFSLGILCNIPRGPLCRKSFL